MASIKRIGKDSLGVTVWEAVYRRVPGEKQTRRRFHMENKADVERAILLDSRRGSIGLKWSEGLAIYKEAKRIEGKTSRSMENVNRAVDVFVKVIGDLGIEDTTSDLFKDFLQRAAARPVAHKYAGKKPRISGPKVANHHRRELLAVARYLLKHTGKIVVIPFERVPPLPATANRRSPLPQDRIGDYLDALPPHIRRPIMLILYYGLRSSAVANLTPESIDGNTLVALDKGDNLRRIPIDPTLRAIIAEALKYRATFKSAGAGLFLTVRGAKWDRTSLLHAAQRAWKIAGLEQKKIHEVRHTLGTLAGKSFTPGMVQAAMGHRSRKSAEVYFHPTEEMAAEVRQKIITDLSQSGVKTSKILGSLPRLTFTQNGIYACPCCSSKFRITNKKGRKSK